MSRPDVKYGKRDHRGGLKESLETIKYITEEEFYENLKEYEYYAVDNRCHEVLFIRKDMEKPYTWLFIEDKQFIN